MSTPSATPSPPCDTWRASTPEPLAPSAVVANVMVQRVLAASPDLAKLAAKDGVVIVVEVPAGEWVDPVAEAWRQHVRRTDDVPDDGDDFDFGGTRSISQDWVEFRRDGTARGHRAEEGNFGVAVAVAAGRSIYGFSPDPRRHLPSALLRVADCHVLVPKPDPAAIRDIVTKLTGSVPAAEISSDLAKVLNLDDFWLARRPGEDAEGCVARLKKMAEARAQVPSIMLDDLHGMDEAVGWGTSLARDLMEFRQGTLPWNLVDRGAMIYGPPGTGKTTFARALAGSCGVPLIASSLAQWQSAGSGHLGDLLKAMADTFRSAKAAAPAILFIDEIDSFGDRDGFGHSNRDYSIQVVNAFLEQLDGVAGREGVVVIGACNNPGRMDPAILRSGRLDRAIAISLPTRSALQRILRFHLGADLAHEDLLNAATLGLGGTGADCERWVRGARRRARHDGRPIALNDLLHEIRGAQRTTPSEWLHRFAIHEAGHAVVLLEHQPEAIEMVTIRQSASVGGGTVTRRNTEMPMTMVEIKKFLVQFLAGRAAEEVLLGNVCAGSGGSADSDLGRATTLATAAITAYALTPGNGSLVWQGMPGADVGSILTAQPQLARRVSRLLGDAYREAKSLVRRHQGLLETIAASLMEQETLDGDQVRALACGARLNGLV